MVSRAPWWLGALVALNVAAPAQRTGPSPRPAAAGDVPRQLDCVFSVGTQGRWGASGPSVAPAEAPLEVRVAEIDVARGTADLMYGAVTVHATVFRTGTVISIVQPPESGAIVIAAVDLAGKGSAFTASYGRTEYYAYAGPGFVSTPRAEQHYGICTRQRP